jgi:hypothetical protein
MIIEAKNSLIVTQHLYESGLSECEYSKSNPQDKDVTYAIHGVTPYARRFGSCITAKTALLYRVNLFENWVRWVVNRDVVRDKDKQVLCVGFVTE